MACKYCQICGKPYTASGQQHYCPTCSSRIPVGMLDDPINRQIPMLWQDGISIRSIANHLSISGQKVRRVLITLGLYTSPMIQQVNTMAEAGSSVEEIAEALQIGRKAVISMLPYSKGAYNLITPTANAAHLRQWREKKDDND